MAAAKQLASSQDLERAQSEHTCRADTISGSLFRAWASRGQIDDSGSENPLKQTEQAQRTLGSLDDLVRRTSPKCQPQSVLRGVSSGVLSRRCTTLAMRLTTKSASWHAAIGSSWRGVLRVGFRGMPSWRQHVRVPVDHEGVPHPGDVQVRLDHELREVAGGLSRPASLATESTPLLMRCA